METPLLPPKPIFHNPEETPPKDLFDFGNTIDIFRTNNNPEKVVGRSLCYFGIDTKSLEDYLKKENPKPTHYHRWTLPKEVKDRLFDLTNEDNYNSVKDIKNRFIKNTEFKINETETTKTERTDFFNNCLEEIQETDNTGQTRSIFKRKSDEESDDTVFFKEIIQKELPDYVGTYTKRNVGNFHAEVVIWDETILEQINAKEYEYNNTHESLKTPNIAPEARPKKRRRVDRKNPSLSELSSGPLFGGGGKRKTQKKTKKKSKSSNKKSKRKNTKCLHKKKGGSYKKKTKKQRRNKKKASLKKK